jgi:hypothetical protein
MKAFLEWTNGKKTVIAALAGLALSWVQAKGWVSGEDAVYLASALTLLTGVAVGHKAVKAGKAE